MCAHDVLVLMAGHLHVDTTTLEARLTQKIAQALFSDLKCQARHALTWI